MKIFEFNVCGVCINPNTPISYTDKNSSYMITTCEVATNAWVYGLSIHCVEQGLCYGGSISTIATYETEDKAINHALREIRDYLKRNIRIEQRYHPQSVFIRTAKKMLQDVEERLNKYAYVQLELF